MNKKTAFIVVSIMLAICIAMPAFAAVDGITADGINAGVKLVSAYGEGADIYTFADASAVGGVTFESASIISGKSGASSPLTTVGESDTPAAYLILIDTSATMAGVKRSAETFAEELAKDSEDAVFAVATCADGLKIEAEGLVGKKAVSNAVKNVKYEESAVGVFGGIVEAYEYLRGVERDGEAVNLVIISDGRVPTIDKSAKSALEDAIASHPDVIAHTLCVGAEWGGDAFKALDDVNGMRMFINAEMTAAKAGHDLAQYVNGLYAACFKGAGELTGTKSVQLEFAGKDGDGGDVTLKTSVLSGVPMLITSRPIDTESEGSDTADTADPIDTVDTEEPDSTEEPAATDESATDEPATDAPDTDVGRETESGTDAGTDAGTDGFTAEAETDAETGGSESFFSKFFGDKVLIWVIVGVVAVLLIIAVIAVARAGKKNKKRAGGAAAAGKGIYMKLDVIAGSYAGPKTLYLDEELTIGSKPKCDIVWKNPDVAPVHARIFVKDQIVYIEDFGTPDGTRLGGMRIYAPNRLRSGDEISMGSVAFRLRF